jgi:hypothetical protein
MTLVDQPAVEIDTDDEAMLEALTLAGEEVIRADTDGTFCHPHATRLPCARLLNDLVCQDQKGRRYHDSPPYTFFLLNGDMELHRNR